VNLMPVPLEPGNERAGWVLKDVPGLVTTETTIHSCPNGPSWEETTKPDRKAVGIYYFGGRFVAPVLSINGSESGKIMYSTNGRTWTLSNDFPSMVAGNHITTIAYGNGIYVAYGNATTQVWQSGDAITWALASGTPNVGKLSEVNGMWFGDGVFVIAKANTNDLDPAVYSSASASGLTEHTAPVDFLCGMWAEDVGLHYAGAAHSGDIYTSPDLDTWTLLSTPYSGGSNQIKKIVANGAKMVVIDGGVQHNFIAYSTNHGATWSHSTGLPVPAAFYVDLMFISSQNLWMLCDKDGFVYLSHDDGASWTLADSTLEPFLGTNQDWYMAAKPDGFLYAAVPSTSGSSTVAAVGVC
jgi:hypothetical protein